MKLIIEANDFCPENCRNCRVDYKALGNAWGDEIRIHYCENNVICKYAYELGRKAATDEIAGGKQ